MRNRDFLSRFLNNTNNINTLHKSIVIEITRKCNHYQSKTNSMGCEHCFQLPLKQQTINLNTLEKLLVLASPFFPVIGIVGGEPLMEFDLVKYIIQKSPNNLINIFTSGELLNSKHIQFLKQFENVVLTISLHGKKDQHMQLTGYDSYCKILDNIKSLNDNNIKWIRKVVASKININYILSEAFIIDSLLLGCQSIDVCRFYDINLNGKGNLKIDKNEFLQLDHRLKQLTKEGICIYQEGYGKKCKSLICIDIEGKMLPCPYKTNSQWDFNKINTEFEFFNTINNIKSSWIEENSGQYYCNMLENYFAT